MKIKKDIIILAMKFFPASGGSATYAYNLALGLCQQGQRVLLLAPSYGNRSSDDSVYPFTVRRMRMTNEKFSLIRHFVTLIYVMIYYYKYKPHYIWATTYAGCAVLGMVHFSDSKTIGTVHGGGIHRRFPPQRIGNRPGNYFGLRFIRNCNAVITVSEEAKKMIVNRLKPYGNQKDFQVIYNGISFRKESFRTKKESLSRFPELQNKKILLTVGRLVRAKGHDIVIQAVHTLTDQYPELVYIICGEGPEKQNLIRLTQLLSLEQKVQFKGYVSDEDLEWYYGLCDVFVMTGRETDHFVEGFGLVFIEAGLRGKPVIGTRVGGIPEAIRDNETGLIVEPENIDQTACAISKLLSDPDLGRQFAYNAGFFVEKNFTTDIMAKKNIKLLHSLS